MDRDRQNFDALTSPDALLDESAVAAMSHARKHRTGLRGWKSSQLTWNVEEQHWDDSLGCSVVVIAAQPFQQPEVPQALWEYWLDDRGNIMPGFPVAKRLPDWRVSDGPEQGRRIDRPRPTKREAIMLIVAIAVAAVIVSGALAWVGVHATGDDDKNGPAFFGADLPTPASSGMSKVYRPRAEQYPRKKAGSAKHPG